MLLDLRRELDCQGTSSPEAPLEVNVTPGKGVRGTASPEKASDKAEEKARVKAEKAAAKEALKAEKAAAKLAAREEAKLAREEAKLEAKAAKLAEREAKKEANKLEREAAREAKKAEREAAKAAKKVSKKAAAVAKADSEPTVADEVELVVEAYESESEMVCDGAKNEAVPWDAWPVPRALLSRDTGEEACPPARQSAQRPLGSPLREYRSECY